MLCADPSYAFTALRCLLQVSGTHRVAYSEMIHAVIMQAVNCQLVVDIK